MARQVDLLQGSIPRSLTLLALPIMGSQLVQMAYNLTDMIWIGRMGSGAVAAVGAAGMFMWLSNGLADTKFALGALDMANGHGFRGFGKALSAFVSARLEHRRRRKRLGL